MRVSILALFIFMGSLFATDLGPFVKQQQNQLQKSAVDKALPLIVSGDAGLAGRLEAAGIPVESDINNRVTVRVSRSRLNDLLDVRGVQRIVMGPKQKPDNSKSTDYQNKAQAYAKGYTGTNVIVGIVDSGLDFYHPMFKNNDGTTRVLYLWDQTGSGANPTGYSYGAEYTSSQINQDFNSGTPHSLVPEIDTDGHGTHVAGSFAGYDFSLTPADTISGSAVNANIIFVKTDFFSSSILDGIKYIFDKAQALGKPAVVNLSLGSQFGPHDGTDDGTVAVDDLTGPGKVIIRSAGNDGSDNVHYFNDAIRSSDQIKFGICDYATGWLEKGDDVNSVSLSWEHGSIASVTKNNNNSSGNVTLYLYTAASSNNSKVACYVIIDDTTGLGADTFTLTFNGLSDANSNGTLGLHLWTSENALQNPTGGFSQGTLYSGNNGQLLHYPYTLGNAACGNNIISVGAFVSRHNWPASDGNTYHFTYNGDDGGIANFSSVGPTADGRKKPDIVAGGTILLSARSSDATYSNAFLPPAPYTDNYGYKQGTSMSSPAAAGAIALLLEKNPSWGPAEVLTYLSGHAQGTSRPAGVTASELKVKEDPNNWDKVFGYGAIDLTDAFNTTALDDGQVLVVNGYELEQNYPNPFNPLTTIRYKLPIRSFVELTLYDVSGRRVKSLVDEIRPAGANQVQLDAGNLASGIYYYKLKTQGFTLTRKMTLLK